jgi:glycosyltransferase involved in cell wall biosynthesis
MSQPFFSIITCTYNSEQYLPECIDSVRSQQFSDYEHIIVDAYSTDSTPRLIEVYTKSDDRARLVQAEPKGIANAMNRGITEAKGKVVQHLHSDDYFHSDQTLGIVHEAFVKNPRKSLVIGLCSRIVDGTMQSGLLQDSTFKRRKLLLRYLIHVHCYIAHPATFIKKEVFERHGMFDESFRIAMDYEYWLRILGKEPYLMMNRELTTFRRHAAAASSDNEKNLADEIRARKLHSRGFRANVARMFFTRAVALKENLNRE